MMFPFAATNSYFNPSVVMYRNSTACLSDDDNNFATFPDVSSVAIRPNDVLCGRGKVSFTHSGNRRFRHIISQSVDEYKSATSKWEKSLVAAKLVNLIQASGGRFLKQKRGDDAWYELSSSESKSKVSHAIRDAIAATRQTQQRRSSMESCSQQQPVVPADTKSQSPSCLVLSAVTTVDRSVPPPSPQRFADGHPLKSPLYRGTWSSNSLVSIQDGDDNKCPDAAAVTDEMSDESMESNLSEDFDEDQDDFLSFINETVPFEQRK